VRPHCCWCVRIVEQWRDECRRVRHCLLHLQASDFPKDDSFFSESERGVVLRLWITSRARLLYLRKSRGDCKGQAIRIQNPSVGAYLNFRKFCFFGGARGAPGGSGNGFLVTQWDIPNYTGRHSIRRVGKRPYSLQTVTGRARPPGAPGVPKGIPEGGCAWYGRLEIMAVS